MMKQLILREWRATRGLVIIATAMALLVMGLARWTLSSWISLSFEEAFVSAPWALTSIIHILLAWQIFGREWRGKGRRTTASFGIEPRSVLIAKFTVLFTLAFLVSSCVVGVELLCREDWLPLSVANLLEQFSILRFVQMQLALLSFATFFSILLPMGSGAVVATLTLGAGYFFGVCWLHYTWLSYHDVAEDALFTGMLQGAAWLSPLFFVIAALVFLGGRLHRRNFLRPAMIALGILLLAFPLGQTWVQGEVRAWETFDMSSPDLVLEEALVLRDQKRIVLQLGRIGHFRKHTAILDFESGGILSLFPAMVMLSQSLESDDIALADLNSCNLVESNFERTRSANTRVLTKDGLLRSGELEGPTIRIPQGKVHSQGQLKAWAGLNYVFVFDESTGKTKKYVPPHFVGVVPWRGHWVMGDVIRSERRTVGYAVRLVDMFSHEESTIDLPEAYVASPTMTRNMGVPIARNGMAYYVAKDRARVLAMNLETKQTSCVFTVAEDHWPIQKVRGDGDPHYLMISYDGEAKKKYVGVLNLETGNFKSRLDESNRLWLWGAYGIFRSARSPDGRFNLIHSSNNQSTNYWQTDTLENVVSPERIAQLKELGLIGSDRYGLSIINSGWIGACTLLLWNKDKLASYNLETDELRILWQANR